MSPEVIRGAGYSFSCDWWSVGVIGEHVPQNLTDGDTDLRSASAFECLYGYPPFVSNSVRFYAVETRPSFQSVLIWLLLVIDLHVATRHEAENVSLECTVFHDLSLTIPSCTRINWKQSLRFPTKPKVSKDCTDFISRLLCEPEDRLGSRKDAVTVSTLRGPPTLGLKDKPYLGDDGAKDLKRHPWFQKTDWNSKKRILYPSFWFSPLTKLYTVSHLSPQPFTSNKLLTNPTFKVTVIPSISTTISRLSLWLKPMVPIRLPPRIRC